MMAQPQMRCLVWVVTMAAICNHALAASLSPSCRSAIDRALPQSQRPLVRAEVTDWASRNNFDPTVAFGDYDGDGRRDSAVLLQTGTDRAVAVCLAGKKRTRLRIIRQPYCDDVLYTSKAGEEHYNYETDKNEQLKRDGIGVECFEKAGATYVYENRTFRRIIDSD